VQFALRHRGPPCLPRRVFGTLGIAAAVCACQPVRLVTKTLSPIAVPTGTSGFTGSKGFCLSQGHPPASSFSSLPGQALVGFDDYFKAGTQPAPCNDIRVAIFRGGVLFDLSTFDNVAIANLTFETLRSAQRSNGENIGQSPPKSFATTLSMATEPFSGQMNADDDASLPAGPSVSIAVGGQVQAWTTKARPNYGFVIWGPLGHVSANDAPENNDAQVSWYGNFALTVTYNPTLNPRAPQN
jgi:hypothetical protein